MSLKSLIKRKQKRLEECLVFVEENKKTKEKLLNFLFIIKFFHVKESKKENKKTKEKESRYPHQKKP